MCSLGENLCTGLGNPGKASQRKKSWQPLSGLTRWYPQIGRYVCRPSSLRSIDQANAHRPNLYLNSASNKEVSLISSCDGFKAYGLDTKGLPNGCQILIYVKGSKSLPCPPSWLPPPCSWSSGVCWVNNEINHSHRALYTCGQPHTRLRAQLALLENE